MKKTISLLFKCGFALQIITANTTYANNPAKEDSLAKSCFYSAKTEIENMLTGKIPLNYERAVFITENAYWDNAINYLEYKKTLDIHTERILNLIYNNNQVEKQVFKKNILYTEEEQKEQYRKLLANWAIYTYLTDTTYIVNKSEINYYLPCQYSWNDPLGTIDWSNSQVLNLLTYKKGNCYALAALYKIFSERLNSDANIATAPSHIFIVHDDLKGTSYNIELASKVFPGSGSIKAFTNTTHEAVVSGISMRTLNLKQSIALCLVYLAKSYEFKYDIKDDNFILNCAESTLKNDSLNLNAMLLKAEVLEERIINKNKTVIQLQTDKLFKEYEKLITSLYKLGYREMPIEIKNLIISRICKDENAPIFIKDQTPNPFKHINSDPKDTRYATLSWGLFDEIHETKPFEKYGRTVFDTKKQTINKFSPADTLYNNYNFDPVVFAWNPDPLASKFPWQSPYCAMDNNPILKNDPTGKSGEVTINKEAKTLTITSNLIIYGSSGSTEIAKQTAQDIQEHWNAAGGKVTIEGVEYNVQFSVTGSYNANLTASNISSNTDIKNNYFKVVESGINISYADGVGSNTGIFLLKNIKRDCSTTEAHEFGHGWGAVKGTAGGHPSNGDLRGDGQPGMMYARGTAVDAPYTYDPSKGATKGTPGVDATNTVNPEKRKVTQADINYLGLDKLKFNSNGKANLGTLTNKSH